PCRRRTAARRSSDPIQASRGQVLLRRGANIAASSGRLACTDEDLATERDPYATREDVVVTCLDRVEDLRVEQAGRANRRPGLVREVSDALVGRGVQRPRPADLESAERTPSGCDHLVVDRHAELRQLVAGEVHPAAGEILA